MRSKLTLEEGSCYLQVLMVLMFGVRSLKYFRKVGNFYFRLKEKKMMSIINIDFSIRKLFVPLIIPHGKR